MIRAGWICRKYSLTRAVVGLLLVAGLSGLATAATPDDADGREDIVAEAFEEARGVRADLFVPHSSVLGKLPGPAGLAAAQPQFREMFACEGANRIEFTPEQKAQLRRDFKYYSYGGGPRSDGPTSLGVTGAYVDSLNLRGELFVTYVVPNTPAAGKLQSDDVIIGANGKRFRPAHDPRLPMGYALYESTTPKLGGKLVLQILRDGEAMNVEMKLPVLPPYAEHWPYDCPRSKAIADRMLELVLECDGSGGRSLWTTLFLLASGDDAALDMARRQIYRGLKDEYPAEKTGKTWGTSYRLLNLTEYYLITGDSKVLKEIEHHRAVLQSGQSAAGGWGHSCPCAGYGEVNCTGLTALASLAMARECRVKMDPEALAQSIRYSARFIGSGAPYGDHSSGLRLGASNNGKASMGAVAYRLFGLDDVGERWGRACAYMYLQPEAGHAEGIFNLAWDPLAAAQAPIEEFAIHMNNRMWYYELARTHEGGLRFFRGGHFGYPVGQTAAIGLAYMLARKKIYLTGAPRSVFAIEPPDHATADAAMYYRRKNWKALKAALTRYLADDASKHKDYARKLLDAYERMEANAAASIKVAEENIRRKRVYAARNSLIALGHALGEQRPEIVRLLKLTPERPARVRHYKGFPVEPKLTLRAAPPEKMEMVEWKNLLPMMKAARGTPLARCKVYRPGKSGSGPEGDWYAAKYEAAGWRDATGAQTLKPGDEIWLRRDLPVYIPTKSFKQLVLSSKSCQGELYLNGYRLADFDTGDYYLGAGAVRALKQGVNVLAIHVENPYDGIISVDFTLKSASDLKLPEGPVPMPGLEGLTP